MMPELPPGSVKAASAVAHAWRRSQGCHSGDLQGFGCPAQAWRRLSGRAEGR